MPVERYFTGTPWEPYVGYCRALRVGERILVAGTVGVDDVGRPAGDVHEQARAALERICTAVEALGGRRSDIARPRISPPPPVRDGDATARAPAAVLGEPPPVSALLGTSQ